MSQIIATQQLIFDDFKKDEYRAFKLEGQPAFMSLPTIHDRIKDMLMEIERQMDQGDHLAITLTVSRPSNAAQDMADAVLRSYRHTAIGHFP